MTDRLDASKVIADCETYWRQTGVPAGAISEMRLELEQHLNQAVADGRSVEDVVGNDVAGFAESWASVHRGKGLQTYEPVRTRPQRMWTVGYLALVIGAVALGLILGRESNEPSMPWAWLWTGLAFVMAIGEIFTAGFFLLPFAIGAIAAALLGWLGVSVLAQWIVFFVVSIASLFYLQRFIRRQDEGDQPAIGANRYSNAQAVVLERIDPVAGTGLVRVNTEKWRATSAGETIESGTPVRVTEITGARLVVKQRS